MSLDDRDLATGGVDADVDVLTRVARDLSRSSWLRSAYDDLAADTDAFGANPGLVCAWGLRDRNARAFTAAFVALDQVDALLGALSHAVSASGEGYAEGDAASAARNQAAMPPPTPLMHGVPRTDDND